MKVFAFRVYWINCVFYICVATAAYINDSLLGMRLSKCSIENNVQIVLDSGTFHIFVRDAQPIPFIEARWSPNGKTFFLHKSRTLKALGVPSLIHVSPWEMDITEEGNKCISLNESCYGGCALMEYWSCVWIRSMSNGFKWQQYNKGPFEAWAKVSFI